MGADRIKEPLGSDPEKAASETSRLDLGIAAIEDAELKCLMSRHNLTNPIDRFQTANSRAGAIGIDFHRRQIALEFRPKDAPYMLANMGWAYGTGSSGIAYRILRADPRSLNS